jgi:hypothetical protein
MYNLKLIFFLDTLKLPPAFKQSVTRAMFQNINPQFSFSEISVDAESRSFPAWKSSKFLIFNIIIVNTF